MCFDVAFCGDCEMYIQIHTNHVSESSVRVPILEIAKMIHFICDDLDMVRPQDMEELKEAINRFNRLMKVEN